MRIDCLKRKNGFVENVPSALFSGQWLLFLFLFGLFSFICLPFISSSSSSYYLSFKPFIDPLPHTHTMAPLRSVFSSRSVVFGLSILGALALLISTMDSSRPIIDNYKNQINNAIDNKNNNHNHKSTTSGSGIAWLDANNPPEGKRGGGGQPLAIYPGRKPRTVQRLLEDAKGYYDIVAGRRHEMLAIFHYGTE